MIGGDSIEPGAELRFAAKSWKAGDGFEEDFLRGVFGVFATVEHAEREIEEPLDVTGKEEFELLTVTLYGAGDKLFIGRAIIRKGGSRKVGRIVDERV